MTAQFVLPFQMAWSAIMGAISPGGICRYIPGDSGWPNATEWDALNLTVGGRLIKNVPVAHVCHTAGSFAAYDKEACDKLAKDWLDASAETLFPQPSEMWHPYFQNQSCTPFTAPEVPCELGNRPVYSINVTGAADVQAGLDFATKKNIRLSIMNTGLDYLGKSSGKGSLGLWVYNLKSREILPQYISPSYSGPALKLGAGVIAGEAYELVGKAGYRADLASCGLTGVVGGYLQGGGQGALLSAYGMAADQVLEWEVVTSEGKYLIATPEKNPDLYWAITGGGGGTYGVVLSVIVKLFPDGPAAGGQLMVESENSDAIWELTRTWFSHLPSHITNTRNVVQFGVTKNLFWVFAFVMPEQDTRAIDNLLSSFLPELDRLNLPYELTAVNYTNYLDNYLSTYGPLPYGKICPQWPIISSRLIPRSVLANDTTRNDLLDFFHDVARDGKWFWGCNFFDVNDNAGSPRDPHPANSIHPAWREAVAYCNPQPVLSGTYHWDEPEIDETLRKKLVTDFIPRNEKLTPNSGHVNELDPTYQGNWKDALYGSNYDRLLNIKQKYDPNYLMYGQWAVGSDEYVIDGDGRLCKA